MLRDGTIVPEQNRPLTLGELLTNQRNAWAARALDLELEVAMLRQTLAGAQQRIAELETTAGPG